MRVVIECEGVHVIKHRMADGSKKEYHYAWRGGPRMKSKPGTKEYADEHARLVAERKGVASRGRTLEDLIEHFTGPEKNRKPDFLALSAKTQADHLYAFRLIKEKWPRLPEHLTQQRGMKARIREWHRSFAANPRKADKLLFSLSKVFSYAIADELISKNPCTGIERLYKNTRRCIVWSPEQIRTLRHWAPPHLLLPFLIAYRTGQRQSDVLSRKWSDYDGTHLKFPQSKSDGAIKVRVMLNDELRSILDEMKAEREESKIVTARICTNSRGRPWTPDGFKTSWGKLTTKAGITGVTFHDLRGTFITERWREGSTPDQIATISGHSAKEVKTVLESHYLAPDQDVSDAVILRMK